MTLDQWLSGQGRPTLQSRAIAGGVKVDAVIHEVVMPYMESDREHYKDCRDDWREKGMSRCSNWNRYRSLVAAGSLRFHYAFMSHPQLVGFGEGFAALALEQHGFQCATGLRLFGRQPRAESRTAITGYVSGRLAKVSSISVRAFEKYVDVERKGMPKNPDIFGYSDHLNECCFCEVKQTEQRPKQVSAGQRRGLAVLHLLTDAPVAVVRLVGPGDDPHPRSYPTRFRISAEGVQHTKMLRDVLDGTPSLVKAANTPA